MSGRLGCAERYTAAIHDRGGTKRLADLDNLTTVRWSRRLNETSTASVVIAKAGAACCGVLANIMPWIHELSIYRTDSKATRLVWQGPITNPHETAATFTIEARDLTGWFKRWDARTYGKLPALDAVVRFKAVLDAHFARGTIFDPGMAHYIAYNLGAPAIAIEVSRGDTIDDVLGLLTDTAMDFTAIGRRVVAMPAHYDYGGRIAARLDDRDLGGDIESGLDGDAIITWAMALGTENPTTQQPYYSEAHNNARIALWGLHFASTTSSNATTATVLQPLANKLHDSGAPPQRVIRLPDEATLLPDAAVEVAELVPGVRIDVMLTHGWCRPLAERARLVGVAGSWQSGSDEQISISLTANGPAVPIDAEEPS